MLSSVLNRKRQVHGAIVLLAVLTLTGCIATKPSQTQPVQVMFSPSSENFVPVNGTLQFTLTVTGSSAGVAWNLSQDVSCILTNLGTITPNSTGALYTAPPSVPNSTCAVVLTATSNADTSVQFQVLIYVQEVITISAYPPQNQIVTGGTFQFAATVTGNTGSPDSQSVLWSVPQGGGSIDATSGFYTAPSSPLSGVTVTATSQYDTSGKQPSASTTIDVISSSPPPPTITVSPDPASIPVGGTQQFAATETGVSNPTFTWSAAAASGCTATNVGSINSSGLYTAPPTSAILPASPCPVEVTASVPGATGSVLANLHVAVAINGPPNYVAPPTSMGAGANWLYTATVNGASSSNQAISWSTSGTPGGCEPGLGSFPSSTSPYTDPNGGFYEAPLCVPPSPVTITATSAFDSTQSQLTTVTILANDPVGTATGATTTCPSGIGGTTGATCYTLDVSCPGIADWPNTYLKVNQPTGTALGTVILGTGSGGNYVYDNDSPDYFYTNSDGDSVNGGLGVVNGILTAGYRTVQVAFSPLDNPAEYPNGWLTGPGGVRRLACRYAAVAQWVYTNIHKSNTSAPMCATGNSGGAGAIGYAVTDYGLSDILAMVETTSGPPMTRIDKACAPPGETQPFVCNSQPSVNLPWYYSLEEAGIIDPSYPASEPFCANAINASGTQAPNGLFLSDSILGGPLPATAGTTYVNIVVGGQDGTAAVTQASNWGQAIGQLNRTCVEDAPHAIPAAPSGDGVTQIVSDIQNLCKLQ